MAREKMSGFTADEAAAVCDNEQAVTSSSRSKHAAVKKKLSNRRCGDMIVGGGDTAVGGMHQSTGRKSGASNGSGHSYTGSKGFTQRSNKTLGWFLNDGLLSSASGDNRINKNAGESSSSPPTMTGKLAAEVEGSENANSIRIDEEKKRGRRAKKLLKKTLDLKASADSVGNSEDAHVSKPTSKSEYSKDDYWYYDPASDGFYYENMGSRGWRRRMPISAQKRHKMEQEIYAAFLRDPSQFAYLQTDAYGFAPGVNGVTAAYCAAPQIKYYDPASDGYYFEMPSVDGWKKRQPNSSSSSSSGPGSSTSRFNYKGADFLRSEFPHHEQSQVTSYGAALARGQLPPAYTLADSAVYSQDPFSSDASSMSTLSSLSEGTPTPPPRTQISTSNERNGSLFPDGSSLDDYFAEQYDRTLQLDEVAYEDGNEGIRSGNPAEHNVRSCPFYTMEPATYADVAATSSAAEDLENTTSSNKVTYEESNEDIRSRKPAAHHLPSRAFYTMEPAAYADVVATSCAVEDLENTPPNKEVMFKRPGTLHLRTALVEDGQNSESELNDRKKRNCHELLRNFNADKFIADMGYYGSNVERVLRDLAALKTPVAPPTVCSADSPHTPAVCSDLPSWARAPERQTNVSDDWWLGDTSGAYIDDIWSRDVSTCSNAKSKLSIWRDAELLTAVPCDNN